MAVNPDKLGRRKTLLTLLLGLTVGYSGMSMISSEFWLPFAVIITMFCSFFVQAGAGAVFAMVPIIKRRMTGQIAGMVGAYGNVGAVSFLTVLSFVEPRIFFLVIAVSALVTCVLTFFLLKEPKGQTAEVMPDGSIQMIDVS